MDQVLINKNFKNFEDFAMTARAWDVDFMQIEKGRFEANLIQYISKNLQFARARFNRRLDQRGSPPKGMWTFAITASADISLFFKGREANENSIMIYPPGSEIDAISQSRFDILTFSATESFFEALAEKNKVKGFKKKCRGLEFFNGNKNNITELRILLTRLFSYLKNIELQPNESPKKHVLIDIIPEVLFRAIYNHDKSDIPSMRLRDGALKQAMECIKAHAGENLTVKGLLRQTGVSERTLEYAFNEYLGVSPKQYIRIYRLHRVRRELIKSSRSTLRINDIANIWGFWHMGQFAKDYKNFFGELPSVTLGKLK